MNALVNAATCESLKVRLSRDYVRLYETWHTYYRLLKAQEANMQFMLSNPLTVSRTYRDICCTEARLNDAHRDFVAAQITFATTRQSYIYATKVANATQEAEDTMAV